MYVRTIEGFREQRPTIDLEPAIRLNRQYARSLGWQVHVSHIVRLLGFTCTPDERDFAEGVARWQRHQGRPPDGILEAGSWARMRALIASQDPSLSRQPMRRALGDYLAEPKKKAKYDRSAALDYARRHWNVPCNDGFIALAASSGKNFAKVAAGTKFEHEFDTDGNSRRREHASLPGGSRIEWKDLDDCTHYLSCCIGEPPADTAGGIPITYRQLGSPPKAPYGIVRVSTLVSYLRGRNKQGVKYVKLIGEKTSDDSLIKKLAPGDLIAYWNNDRSSRRYKRYTHMAIYLGNNKIGCHTYCRSDDPACTWDNDWDLGRGTHRWTFLHFIV